MLGIFRPQPSKCPQHFRQSPERPAATGRFVEFPFLRQYDPFHQADGKILLDLIPKIYDTERVMRIIGVDGRPDMVTINQKTAIGEVMNDITVGEYDVVMDTGPGYNSKRLQAVEAAWPRC